SELPEIYRQLVSRFSCFWKRLAGEYFPDAHLYFLEIGVGKKKSSAQVTDLYSIQDLIGRLVVCVTNFPPKQIGPFISEVLTLGVSDEKSRVILLKPDSDAPLGSLVF
ncbi:hypothetical protein A3C52_03725, partial [Candidatus Peribacteria bacterium RIFCSPHIGHO2_02_FULL_51_15]